MLDGIASANIVADTDVEVYVFEGQFIDIVYATRPELASRFFYYLATVLSARFDSREKVKRKA